MEDWRWMSAGDLSRGIGSGEIDPVALTETFLDAIEAHALSPRIYARTTPERARAEARAAAGRAKAGRRRSPLDGVPVSWKDLFDSAGVATEAGSRLLEGRVPAHDATVLRNATEAGLVCLGKTHMTELAFSGIGLNPMTGSPPCVNDEEAVSGGSSSGAATSVGFGLAAAATGSDTGGSIRAPAAWNDLVGLKTGPGALPMEGVVPLCPRFDTLGPLARNVEDASLFWAAMAGRTAPDLEGASIEGRRFLALETVAMEDLDPAVDQGYRAAVERLRGAGAVIEWREIPAVARAVAQSSIVFAAEAYAVWRDTIEARPEVMYPPVRERFRGGRDVSAPDYLAAWRVIDECREAYHAAAAGFDAVILPTCPILPPNRHRLETEEDYFVSRNLMTLRNTRIGNYLGLTGLTLPTGTPSVGCLLQTPAGSEARLLRLGRAAERALA
ncbi:aspartyl-tRNA(Asn)/glutamyl-tRNA(Gln) amidotransferase subunit A [Palleronia aestuarii]|uniref:Aspartyl-tRNA(Asn)/glutamyl-tRNA(Gln) amidotransferase subunit A n=1 Tax=Palleronia aestuarii TaxID=568105 RepID=A0A2W7NG05_9RHOB|nr:amidase family protein [Palleronia aestuarii]PZX18840.1 aspartyl-tRNA(Asn)/glutamyl-tRNA(Gln) amidotransferase subunit A [Palleronia aestuarii]